MGEGWRGLRSFLAAGLLIYLAAVIGALSFRYYDTRGQQLASLDRELLAGASAVRYVLADDFHDRAVTADAIARDEDWRNIRALSRFAERAGFAFVYSAIERDGQILLTSSSATQEELAAGTEVHYFDPFDEVHANVVAVLAQGEPLFETYTDRWGTFRAALVPELSPGGRPFVAAAEFEISDVRALLARELVATALTAILLLAASLPLFGLLLWRERRISRELTLANERLRNAQESMVKNERLNALGTLAAGVAHELNNPLMGIINYVQYAADVLGRDHPLGETLRRCEQATQVCIQIVNDLLVFSRGGVAGGGAGPPVRCEDVLDRVLRLLEFRVGRERIGIEKTIAEGLPLVSSRGTGLQQVLMNLIANALDALADSETKRVQIEVWPTTGGVHISVSDTGPGMDAETLARIYEPFFSTKAVGKGTGLGLSVTLGIIEGAGGWLRCTSEPGQGARFELFWPAATPDDKGAAQPEESK
ncbi:sensor histidine kinase [Thiococcus pfennigii]|uniref:sensor histidine kinase n=1 Tax=Thiococcus pfennigii TaxID=1057 RepID=UPI001907E165|nr:ATP-binding protein [Thiococcus pfennigii]MBK1699801.1 hypothetical protein [Thiococcus pfennigii]